MMFRKILITKGRGVSVALLDSGLHQSTGSQHRTFIPVTTGDQIFEEQSLSAERKPFGHGDIVQNCLLNVAPAINIDHYRILDEQNACSGQQLCDALGHVIDKGYNIINLSLGTCSDECLQWLVSLMKQAYEKNISIVAACSNIGNAAYPAMFTYCVSVNAMRLEHAMKLVFHPKSAIEFSGWGLQVPINQQEKLTHVSGTSYAAAHVSGMMARAYEVLGPDANPLAAKCLLRELALDMAV